MRWQALVFDLDDTLYPEREYVRSGFRAVAEWAQPKLGLPAEATAGELWQLFTGGARRDTFDRWLAARGLPASDFVPAMVEVYRQHAPRIAPHPRVAELLDGWRRRHRLGLVSDGWAEVQERKLAALGLAGCFTAIVFSDTLGRDAWKPSPRPFRRVLELLTVPAAEAVYVADNPAKDFRGASSVGMGAVRVRYPDGLYAGLEPLSLDDAPEREISRLDELEAIAAA